jgi:aryl-alcohol dehydrogenase-like predicted oxidoreductase
VVPIPGTKRRKCLEENAAAADLRLSAVIAEGGGFRATRRTAFGADTALFARCTANARRIRR